MLLNFGCQLVPLNLFLFEKSSQCVPVWATCMFLAQAIGLYFVLAVSGSDIFYNLTFRNKDLIFCRVVLRAISR